MKKILLGLVLLVLTGCLPNHVTFDYLKKEINGSGGHVRVYGALGDPSVSQIIPIANAQCQRFNSQSRAVNLTQPHKGAVLSGSEFSYWHYDCTTEKQLDFIDEAKNSCKKIGFKEGTTDFSNCTLELVKKQTQQPTNNTIVIQNDGNANQEMIDRGLGMMSGKRGLDGQLKTPAPTMQIPRTLNCTEMVISRNPYMTKQVCN
jgi:hypothetical protein